MKILSDKLKQIVRATAVTSQTIKLYPLFYSAKTLGYCYVQQLIESILEQLSQCQEENLFQQIFETITNRLILYELCYETDFHKKNYKFYQVYHYYVQRVIIWYLHKMITLSI